MGIERVDVEKHNLVLFLFRWVLLMLISRWVVSWKHDQSNMPRRRERCRGRCKKGKKEGNRGGRGEEEGRKRSRITNRKKEYR